MHRWFYIFMFHLEFDFREWRLAEVDVEDTAQCHRRPGGYKTATALILFLPRCDVFSPLDLYTRIYICAKRYKTTLVVSCISNIQPCFPTRKWKHYMSIYIDIVSVFIRTLVFKEVFHTYFPLVFQRATRLHGGDAGPVLQAVLWLQSLRHAGFRLVSSSAAFPWYLVWHCMLIELCPCVN